MDGAGRSRTVKPARSQAHLPVVLLAASLSACAGLDAETNTFATLSEAQRAGAVAQGWVPAGLPPETHDLREAHVPGTTRRWGIIEFPPAESDRLRALLRPEEFVLTGQRCEMPRRIEWWPIVLRGVLDGERLTATGLRGYRAREGDLIFAVNWDQGRAYYWAATTPF